MQFSEGLSDRQAAEAVRARIDWKYVLGLELDDAGFDYSVLSEFRERLVAGEKEQLLLARQDPQIAGPEGGRAGAIKKRMPRRGLQ